MKIKVTYLKVIVLGTAQDGGVPQIACYCPTCNHARENPKAVRLKPSLGIFDPVDGAAYIVDASPDLPLQLDILHKETSAVRDKAKFPLDGIFLTHGHFGHIWGLGYLGKEACSPKGLPLYCTHDMAEYLRKNRPFADLVQRQNVIITELLPGAPVKLSSKVSVTPMGVTHRQDVADTMGFIISGEQNKLLYIPDMDDYTDEIIEAICASDIAILDGCFYSTEELPNRNLKEIPHPFIPYSMEKLSHLVGKTQIYFTHFNHSNYLLRLGSKEKENLIANGFRMANDGDEFTL